MYRITNIRITIYYKTHKKTNRAQNDRNRTRRTHEVPFIVA